MAKPRLAVIVVWTLSLSGGFSPAQWRFRVCSVKCVSMAGVPTVEKWLLCCYVFVSVLYIYRTLESSSQGVLQLVRAFVRKRRGPSTAAYTRSVECSGNKKGIWISSWIRALSSAQTCCFQRTLTALHQRVQFSAVASKGHFDLFIFPLLPFHPWGKGEGKTLSPFISTPSSQVSGWVLEMCVP